MISALVRLRLEPALSIWTPEPFITINIWFGKSKEENRVRTAGFGRGMEDGSNFGVHLNGQASIHHKFLVPHFDLGLDPIREDVLEDRGAHVGNPLLRDLIDLFTFWKIHQDICLTSYEVTDFFEAESFILRNLYMSNIWPEDGFLGTTRQILEKIDGYLLCRVKIKVSDHASGWLSKF